MVFERGKRATDHSEVRTNLEPTRTETDPGPREIWQQKQTPNQHNSGKRGLVSYVMRKLELYKFTHRAAREIDCLQL